jgi:hypothetical protein
VVAVLGPTCLLAGALLLLSTWAPRWDEEIQNGYCVVRVTHRSGDVTEYRYNEPLTTAEGLFVSEQWTKAFEEQGVCQTVRYRHQRMGTPFPMVAGFVRQGPARGLLISRGPQSDPYEFESFVLDHIVWSGVVGNTLAWGAGAIACLVGGSALWTALASRARVVRRALRIAAIVACLAVGGLWLWSGCHSAYVTDHFRYECQMKAGVLSLSVSFEPDLEPGTHISGYAVPSGNGFRLRWAVPSSEHVRGQYLCVELPIWLLLSGMLLGAVVLFHLTRPRRAPGTCQMCGYNLTGNVSGRCPECGTTVPGGPAGPADDRMAP